jgi:hypothetical protein
MRRAMVPNDDRGGLYRNAKREVVASYERKIMMPYSRPRLDPSGGRYPVGVSARGGWACAPVGAENPKGLPCRETPVGPHPEAHGIT